MRVIRDSPFCWQEKSINRLLRKNYTGPELTKRLCLYASLTEIENDFNGADIHYYTKTIHKYSGLSKRFIPGALADFEKLGIIKITDIKENGRFKSKLITFTPDGVDVSTVSRSSTNGSSTSGPPVSGKTDNYKKNSLLKEEQSLKEEQIYIPGKIENLEISLKGTDVPIKETFKPQRDVKKQTRSADLFSELTHAEQLEKYNNLYIGFQKKICKYFLQEQEHLERGVFGYLFRKFKSGELPHFIRITDAYIEYKTESNEIPHKWTAYSNGAYMSEDYQARLKLLKENPKPVLNKQNAKNKTNNRNYAQYD